MRSDPQRWEHGSFQHWPDYEPSRSKLPWPADTPLWLSARSCLVALHRRLHWRRLWIPEYFCQQVARTLAGAGIELESYSDSPQRPAAWANEPLRAGDAILSVNTLGLRANPEAEVPAGVDLVEDHTHDPLSPWAETSLADWAIASVRKTVPTGIGGVLWSPRERPTPAPPTSATEGRSIDTGLGAMLLKRLYLTGHPVVKADYLEGFAKLEALLDDLDPLAAPRWAAALVATFPWHEWRAKRADNAHYLASRLSESGAVEVLEPATGAVPFAVAVLPSDAESAERLRRGLIERSIYPARLWDLEDPIATVSPPTVELSRRLLVLHCDYRYSRTDLDRVARSVAEILS